MEMELQCCGEFEAESRKYKTKPLTIQKYLDFCVNHKHSDLTADHLRKIISIDGFKSLYKVKKVLIDVVDSIKLMDLTRSTINDDSVSSYAFITSQEAIKDLICLNWIECSVTSFKTLNYDLISLQNASTFGLKSYLTKKKRTKMIRSKEGIQPVCSLASGDQCSVAVGKIALLLIISVPLLCCQRRVKNDPNANDKHQEGWKVILGSDQLNFRREEKQRSTK